jgi:hypothetical protein
MNDNNFYSMDKLIEFGMSISIASQMAQSMNRTINQMTIPGSSNAMLTQIETVYYAVINGKQAGPYSLTELSRLIKDKIILKETYIWKPGMAQWDLVENVDELLRLVAVTPPPIPNL